MRLQGAEAYSRIPWEEEYSRDRNRCGRYYQSICSSGSLENLKQMPHTALGEERVLTITHKYNCFSNAVFRNHISHYPTPTFGKIAWNSVRRVAIELDPNKFSIFCYTNTSSNRDGRGGSPVRIGGLIPQ